VRRFFFFRHYRARSLHQPDECNPSRVAFASPAPNAPLAGDGLLTNKSQQRDRNCLTVHVVDMLGDGRPLILACFWAVLIGEARQGGGH
jgi:hypothetical protein